MSKERMTGCAPADRQSYSAYRALALFLAVAACVVSVQLMAADPAFGKARGRAGTDIPRTYLKQYRQTGAYYGLDWTIIAGIGKVESRHGRDTAGGCVRGPRTGYGSAYGPMQFLRSTWRWSAQDGNDDGLYDSCDFRDAIPSAAFYLMKHGARDDYYTAIYHYNHSHAYVEDVLAEARKYYRLYR